MLCAWGCWRNFYRCACFPKIFVSGSLTAIDVGFNSIGKEAALNLVSIFQEKDLMKSVGLGGCDLGVDGAKAVAEYVRVSASLTSVWTPAHGP